MWAEEIGKWRYRETRESRGSPASAWFLGSGEFLGSWCSGEGKKKQGSWALFVFFGI
jgi:hypothetical protein